MGKGLPRSRSRGNPLAQPISKVTIPVRDVAMTVDGASGVGFGTAVVGDLPEGNILILGAVSYLSFAASGSEANLDADWEGDYGIGSTPAGDATITGADVDIIPSTAIEAATAEVSPRTRGAGAAQTVLDNTDGSLEINVSLLVDDANIGADDIAFTVNGEIFLAYITLGDD